MSSKGGSQIVTHLIGILETIKLCYTDVININNPHEYSLSDSVIVAALCKQFFQDWI